MTGSFFPPISVAIPNYNGGDLMRRCLPSLAQAVWQANPENEILVVDDASRDQGVAWLKTEMPGVRVEEQPENRGFIATANRAVREARHDIVFLLNNDIRAEEDFLSPVIPHFDAADTFAVTLCALREDGRTFREGAKSLGFRGGLPQIRHAERHQPRPQNGRIESYYAVGGHMALRRAAFLQLGGFDPIFHPFYWEDADLGVRARGQGMKIYYEPRARVIHQEAGVILKSHPAEYVRRIKERNRLLFTWRHFPGRAFLIYHRTFILLRLAQAKIKGDEDFPAAYREAKKIWSEVKR